MLKSHSSQKLNKLTKCNSWKLNLVKNRISKTLYPNPTFSDKCILPDSFYLVTIRPL